MSSHREEGPVYYREIQKNAYLKRIPADQSGSKLRPLGHKKPSFKPMWTLFCIHNGRTPYLEQYPDRDHPSTTNHSPAWRACLNTARHVTASVTARVGGEYDFLVDTEHGSVRMLAPDWDSMQDWVQTLRTKLHELKILSAGENVYCMGRSVAAPAPPRAPARDPTSPLPPTPATPPVRVPGIEPPAIRPSRPVNPELEPSPPSPQEPSPPETIPPPDHIPQNEQTENIDISNWEDLGPLSCPIPSTSQNKDHKETKSVKICGQNICIDDSILKRSDVTVSDEEFFAEIDKFSDSVENLNFGSVNSDSNEFRQTVLVSDSDKCCDSMESKASENQGPNITVIQVSNKEPPHTAIPVMGPETNVFEFEFKRQLPVEPETENADSFINIVNTEVNVQNGHENGYGTVFSKENDYGHVSLMTTVNVTDVNVTAVNSNNMIYERLCMASTSSDKSPLPLKKIKNQDKIRKSSLPNLEAAATESPYEFLFTGSTVSNTNSVAINETQNTANLTNGRTEIHRIDVIPVNVQVNRSYANLNHNTNAIRTSNVERSFSHNEYDTSPRLREHLRRRVQHHNSPKREPKIDKSDPHQGKPIWKRGLTELSFLSRLRGTKQGKRQDSPGRQDIDSVDRSIPTTQVKVIHRSRPEMRADNVRRRSSSLSNGIQQPPILQPLVVSAAARLRNEQLRGAAIPACFHVSDAPVLCEYADELWVARWGRAESRGGGRAGDRVVGVAGAAPGSLARARALAIKSGQLVDVLYHRVPLGKIYVITKKDLEPLGIKLDSECTITHTDAKCRVHIPPGRWALTQVNGRQLNLIKGAEDEMNRLSLHGTEVSILIQPSALVKKLRAALKSNHPLVTVK